MTQPDIALGVGVPDPIVLVLADGDTPAAINNTRGHLFEKFVANLLHIYGYTSPTSSRLNVSSDGIELDVTATHELTGQFAIAECKAYTSPVGAAMLGTFHSKIITQRFKNTQTQGFMIVLPRLTAPGQEQADLIESNDPNFKVLNSASVAKLLHQRKIVVDCPLTDLIVSDPAIVVTEHGVFAACLELDPVSRRPIRTQVWGSSADVPKPVLDLVTRDPFAQATQSIDARIAQSAPSLVQPSPEHLGIIVEVRGSASDFEYQLPASPKYFVGRKSLVEAVTSAVTDNVEILVLNAQSGWGKSSVALKLQSLIQSSGGYALVVDSRTANSPRFVTEAISAGALDAERSGVLDLPDDASWGSLSSALRTLKQATWRRGKLVIFFDQFENVFRDEALTREFRDLALGARDLLGRMMVGFAWKTDLIGWTESHPYQLRDQIREAATVFTLGPLIASEIDTLLRRLEREIGQSLARDLRTRLREYSQGLPWLFKKLAGHLLREVRDGATQEQLASEALNVQTLFDADLAELGPLEQEALRHIARHAPIAISEVIERIKPVIIETLVNRRLVVQVGERLDTYWDIFRDYLNSGRIPIEDSYILRQGPTSVARLLREVTVDGGDSSVPEIANRMGTSENGVFNLSRELRLLGTLSYEPNRVKVLPDIWNSDNQEQELRNRVAASLRRHRAYSIFVSLDERSSGVTLVGYARELASSFSAVQARSSTWASYGRVYLQWFAYAGLVVSRGSEWIVAPEGTGGVGELLAGRIVRRTRGAWPQQAPGPAVALLLMIATGDVHEGGAARGSLRDLDVLQAVAVDGEGLLRLRDPTLVQNGVIQPDVLGRLMRSVPGVADGLAVVEADPQARSARVGDAVRRALSAEWKEETTYGIGKHLRAWAKVAGIRVDRIPRTRGIPVLEPDQPPPSLFDEPAER